MQINVATVDEYIAALPADRAEEVKKTRALILKNLPNGYEETVNWGMITYQIPLERFPDTYNGQPLGYVALASQKNYLAIYLLGLYTSKEVENEFREAYKASGKRLDMGKSCLRFKKFEDLPADLIGKTVAATSVDDYIKAHGAARGSARPMSKR
jgi:hypothetical protein